MHLSSGFELGRFRLKTGVTEAELIAASERMEQEHLQLQQGFVSHHLVRMPNGLYLDIAVAETPSDAERICASWKGQPACGAFLALIEAESIEFGTVL